MNEKVASKNPTKASSCSDEDSDPDHKYEIPAALHKTSSQRRIRLLTNDEEDSNQYFMSEPSISEDGDASSGNVIRAPHRAPLSGGGRCVPSSSDEDRYGGAAGRRQGNAPRQQANVPNSPGNTSLSSWDAGSPAAKKMFLFQFFPERPGSNRRRTTRRDNNSPGLGGPGEEFIGPRSAGPDSSGGRGNSRKHQNVFLRPKSRRTLFGQNFTGQQAVQSTTQALGRQTGIEHFQEPGDLPPQEYEQLMPLNDQHDSHLDRVSPTVRPSDGVARVSSSQVHGGALVAESLLLSPGSSAHDDSNGRRFQQKTDESIAMTLSEDSDQEVVHDEETGSGSLSMMFKGKWEAQNNSADDEQTDIRPPRSKRRVTSVQTGHKRTRSGDSVAAKLATGGKWKGMEQDRIPLPNYAEDDDEDEEDSNPVAGLPIRRESTLGRPPMHPVTKSDLVDHDHPWYVPHETSSLSGNQHLGSQSGSYGSDQSYGWGMIRFQNSYFLPSHENGSPWMSSSHPHAHSPDMCGFRGPHSWQHLQFPGGLAPQNQVFAGDQPAPEDLTQSRWNTANESYGSSDGESSYGSENESGSSESSESQHLPEAKSHDTSAVRTLEPNLDGSEGIGLKQTVERIRQSFQVESPLANIGKVSAEKAPRRMFLPQTSVVDDDGKSYRFFTCPRCGTRQREFFTVTSAPNQDSGPSSYLALYFALYVVASLFIFGLEEGWEPLDCIYFAVITLTTTGLGDKVPTTAGSKIICSIFIYFGVACIGLLLGTYLAGLLDDKASRDRMTKRIESCLTCQQVQNLKEAVSQGTNTSRSLRNIVELEKPKLTRFMSERGPNLFYDHAAVYCPTRGHHSKHGSSHHSTLSPSVQSSNVEQNFEVPQSVDECVAHSSPPEQVLDTLLEASPLLQSLQPSPLAHLAASNPPQDPSILSPVTRRILGRQGHTRHHSFDLTQKAFGAATVASRRQEVEYPPVPVLPEVSAFGPQFGKQQSSGDRSRHSYYGTDNGDDSSCDGTSSSESTIIDIMDENTFRLKAAKYVFLTLRQALVNSLVIIALGSFGFWFIEGFSLVDCWYFSTVLLTTTGYGDIIPTSRGGKLFATIYLLVAGTILLNNMSLISMIPLELRRRRIERAVLTQFGDQLDDAALRELATGPTIQRLHLSANRPDGLDECTREMFSLAMLVRLGKVTEEDIKETFAAFRRLDVNDEGVLNSKSIIAGMIYRRRSKHGSIRSRVDRSTTSRGPPSPPPPPRWNQ